MERSEEGLWSTEQLKRLGLFRLPVKGKHKPMFKDEPRITEQWGHTDDVWQYQRRGVGYRITRGFNLLKGRE